MDFENNRMSLEPTVRRKAFTFSWSIENYVFHTDYTLESPRFTVQMLENTEWYLRLVEESSAILICYLHRAEDEGPERMKVQFSVSLIHADASSEFSFQQSSSHGLNLQCGGRNFRSELNPDGTLNIHCRISGTEGQSGKSIRCQGRTRIGVEHCSRVWKVSKPLERNNNWQEKLTIAPSSTYSHKTPLELLFFYATRSEERPIKIKAINVLIFKKYYVQCKISLMDVQGNIMNSEEEYFIFQRSKDLLWYFPLSVPYRTLSAEKDLYLQDNELTLLCEFSISTGTKFSKLDDGVMRRYSVFPNWPVPSNVPSNVSVKSVSTQTLEVVSQAFPKPVVLFPEQTTEVKGKEDDGMATLKDDLKRLYFQRTFSDVILRVDIHTFAAHKNILCSRCPVFNEIFQASCNETETVIKNVDAETFDRLLLYIYSETLEDMSWEDVKLLYLAAGKYEVASLKKDCCAFLINSLTVSNVSEILHFADMHQENDLKKACKMYICSYAEQVFLTDAWKGLIIDNPLLSSETMHQHVAMMVPEN